MQSKSVLKAYGVARYVFFVLTIVFGVFKIAQIFAFSLNIIWEIATLSQIFNCSMTNWLVIYILKGINKYVIVEIKIKFSLYYI